jgi:hypothetical protein
MQKPGINDAARWLPLILLAAVHAWLVQSCVSRQLLPQQPPECATPPLSTLGLLALSFIELTRGSRTRGGIALIVVAVPLLLRILGDVIN